MKEFIDENGNKRFISEPEGNDWLDEAYRSAEKEIDELMSQEIKVLTRETFLLAKHVPLPPPPPIEDVGMWHRHMLKRMAIDAGKTEEEMIHYLTELDRNPPSFPNLPPADPIAECFKKLKEEPEREQNEI